jgi:hypothetical protein
MKKLKNPGAQCWAALWPTVSACRPGPAGDTARGTVTGARAGRARGAVTACDACTVACWPVARWCSAGDEVLPMSTGGGGGSLRGGTEQDLTDQGLPTCSGDGEAATDDDTKKFVGVGWAPATGDVFGSSCSLRRGRGRGR